MNTRSLCLTLLASICLCTKLFATVAEDIDTHEATLATHTTTYSGLYEIAQASRGGAITSLGVNLSTLRTAVTITITDTGDTVDGSNVIAGGNITGQDKTDLEALLNTIDALLARIDIADDFTTHEGTYNTLLATFNALLDLQGTDRLTSATEEDVFTDLTTLKTSVTTLVTDNSGTVTDDVVAGLSSPEQASIQTLITNTQTLRDRITDWTPIAAMQDAVITALTTLRGLSTRVATDQTIAELETANDTVITNAKTNSHAAAQLAAAEVIAAAGVGEVGGLKTATSQTEFDFELARLELLAGAGNIFDSLESIPALNTALLNALAANPDPSDDTLTSYDNALAAAQDAIETAANTLSTAADLAATPVGDLAATLPESDSDRIYGLAPELLIITNAFEQEGLKAAAAAAKTQAEVDLRNKQRQLLFEATAATRPTLKNAVIASYESFAENNASLAGMIAELNELFTTPSITFPSTPIPVSEIEETVNTAVNNAVSKRVNSLLTSLDIPPSDAVINAGVAQVKPYLYVEVLLTVMGNFVTKTEENDAVDRLAAADPEDKVSTLLGLEDEWEKYNELLRERIADPQVNSTHDGLTENIYEIIWDVINPAGTSADALKWQNLFYDSGTHLSEVASGIVSKFTTGAQKVSTQIREQVRVRGGRRSRRTQPEASGPQLLEKTKKATSAIETEFLRLAFNAYTSESKSFDDGTFAPVNTTPEKVADDFDAENIISGDFTIRDDTPLEAGDEIFIAGATNNIEDPILDAALNKLTANLKFVLKEGGSMGLGAANISTKSGGASPNVLGGTGDETNSIQIVPDGTCYVNLHSDIYITGSKPIVPTANFGRGATHQLVFYSKKEVAIRVGRNVTWDLTGFANTKSGVESGTDITDTATYEKNSKQIVFAGKARLVLEPGATIKFPKVEGGQASRSVLLYFNDEAALVCQADQANVTTRFEADSLTGADCIRNKLFGMGQIWFSGDAHMQITKNAMLGIEANHDTAQTDITFEFQDSAQFLIGSNAQDGGTFQVGNMYEGGSKNNPHSSAPDANFPNTVLNSDPEFVPVKTFVNFTLRLNGSGAKCTIGRNGFFGFGAGIINKSGPMNGTGNNDAWQIQRLYNVGNCTIDITQGVFEHSQIATGTDSVASLFACGPVLNYPAGKYLIKLGSESEAVLRGGGNMLMLSKDASMEINAEGNLVAAPHDVSIGSTRTRITADSLGSSNTGRYSIIAPGTLLRKNWINGLLLDSYRTYGRAWIQPDDNAYVFAGPQEEFFDAITMRNLSDNADKIIPIGYGGDLSTYAYAYIKDNTIIRKSTAVPAMRFVDSTQLPQSVLTDQTGTGFVRVNSLTNGEPTDFKF